MRGRLPVYVCIPVCIVYSLLDGCEIDLACTVAVSLLASVEKLFP